MSTLSQNPASETRPAHRPGWVRALLALDRRTTQVAGLLACLALAIAADDPRPARRQRSERLLPLLASMAETGLSLSRALHGLL
ncbi:hypothetical protein [Rhabdaerophilum sp.]|uniref:hypothetical protein n=1 Tax=Rhabdaerophilum sp. TaxID=2717341 RepID=UPI0038D3BECF